MCGNLRPSMGNDRRATIGSPARQRDIDAAATARVGILGASHAAIDPSAGPDPPRARGQQIPVALHRCSDEQAAPGYGTRAGRVHDRRVEDFKRVVNHSDQRRAEEAFIFLVHFVEDIRHHCIVRTTTTRAATTSGGLDWQEFEHRRSVWTTVTSGARATRRPCSRSIRRT